MPLALVACVLLGTVIMVEGAHIARHEVLEHLSFSGPGSVIDRPSHRPSTLLLLGVLAGVVSLRAILERSGTRPWAPVNSLQLRGPCRAELGAFDSKESSRAPPSR